MKKFILILIIPFLSLLGCNTIDPDSPRMVEVSLSYSLPESGSMTKATAAEVYDVFFEKYIKTGQLLPKPYTLSFKTMDGNEVASISGNWNNNKPVVLATGKYHVSGTSSGGVNYSDQFNTAPLSFDEDIEVSENTSSITLHAIYDCFLLLFDAEGKSYFQWSSDGSGKAGISGDVSQVGDWFYIFVQGFKTNGNVQWNYGGKTNRIWMDKFNFQKGYYYYYNDLSGSFEIPKMQPGTI